MGDNPKWRGSEETRDRRRDYIRVNFPKGSMGFVAEDLDLVIRHHGSTFNTDADGAVRLIECKVGTGEFSHSKRMTFGLLDNICRSSAMANRYEGFYLVYSQTECWAEAPFIVVNGWQLTHDQFQAWMMRRLNVPSIKPNEIPAKVSQWARVPKIQKREKQTL